MNRAQRRKQAKTTIAAEPLTPALRSEFQRAAQLIEQGNQGDARTLLEDILKRHPNQSDAHHLLGVVYKRLQEFSRAEQHLRKSIQLTPNFAAAYYNLANVLTDRKAFDEAKPYYEACLKLNPQHSDCWMMLGSYHRKKDNTTEMVNAYIRAVEINAKNAAAWTHLNECINKVRLKSASDTLKQNIIIALKQDVVRDNYVTNLIISIVQSDPAVMHAYKRSQEDDAQEIWQDDLFKQGISMPFLADVLQISQFPSSTLEYVFTHARKAGLLQKDAFSQWEGHRAFLYALARYAFYAEYAFYISDEEKDALAQLRSTLETEEPSAEHLTDLLLLGSYENIARLQNAHAWADWLDDNHADQSNLHEFAQTHLREPLIERALKEDITQLTPIDDEVSRKVREQYEENPYPRWNRMPQHSSTHLHTLLHGLYPYWPQRKLPENDFEPDIFVAGCGTGQHAFSSAKRVNNKSLTAIDLSRSSLAYAIRKANEAGYTHITFAQADILKLATLDKQYDLVESSGVLHHMQDPEAGWKVLADMTKPGGYMRIGLYSETARKSVVECRKIIEERGYDSSVEDIRTFRHDMLKARDDELAKKVKIWRDFYNLSECRDLFFHVQEHRFTIPQLKETMKRLGLEFVGFEFGNPHVVREFQDVMGAEHMGSLDKWHQFETEHKPDAFAAMYQFWAYKPAA